MTDEEFESVYPVWLLWRATDRRFLPTELLKQPQKLMDGILSLDDIFERIVNQIEEQRNKKKKS